MPKDEVKKGKKGKKITTHVDAMPVVKDPFWPEGAEPLHLTPQQRQNMDIVKAYAPDWKCRKCGATSHQDGKDKTLCSSCAAAVPQNSAAAARRNTNWMDLAEELGIALFERQPEETDEEWRIWCAYREYYPLKMPTNAELAAKVGVSPSTVVRISQKWSFRVRLIAWAQHVDAETQEERIEAVRAMNRKQLGMAQSIQDKLETAIAHLDATSLKPNELVNLFKVATELERRVTEYVEEKVESTAAEAKTKQQVVTKQEDISEIVNILQQAGALGGKSLGVETTTTTRVIAKED